MSKNKWLFFDCYGVIFNEVCENWMENHHLNNNQKNIIRNEIFVACDTGAITFKETLGRLAEVSGFPEEQVEKEWQETTILNQALADLIKKLSQNYNIALLSNASGLVPELKRLGAYELFDKIFISSDMKMRKPEPEIFLAALEECGCRPSDATMIDDRQINIDGAKNVGMNGILYTSVDELEKNLLFTK